MTVVFFILFRQVYKSLVEIWNLIINSLKWISYKPPKLTFCLAKYKFYAGWIDQGVFEVPQKSADKEVKKLRDQGRWKEAWDLAVKWRQ